MAVFFHQASTPVPHSLERLTKGSSKPWKMSTAFFQRLEKNLPRLGKLAYLVGMKKTFIFLIIAICVFSACKDNTKVDQQKENRSSRIQQLESMLTPDEEIICRRLAARLASTEDVMSAIEKMPPKDRGPATGYFIILRDIQREFNGE